MDENAIIIELIKGCLANKKGHQKKLYQAFYGFAHSIALRYMSNREEAAIVMNKGFYRAFTSSKEYKETTSFKKWLHNLLVQAVIQYYFDKTHHLDAIAESKIEYGYSISHNLEKSYAYGDYIKLLHQLPDACRIVFNLFVIDGYKHERIARLLHISVYTSESLLNRARNELRSLISADN